LIGFLSELLEGLPCYEALVFKNGSLIRGWGVGHSNWYFFQARKVSFSTNHPTFKLFNGADSSQRPSIRSTIADEKDWTVPF